MTFDTALSGIRAASSELDVTGNNIANASTTGFKEARAEFGDVYASALLGGGNLTIGSGVQLSSVSQSFSQGNITFTENALDLAINGEGFFILENNGNRSYTRAGAFGVDADGFVVTNDNSRLQGFAADQSGELQLVESDIRLQTTQIDPNPISLFEQSFNLDASAPVLVSNGVQFSSNGPEIGIAQPGTTNAYGVQAFNVINPDGEVSTYTSSANQSAGAIAGEINGIQGVSATASTTATVSNFNNGANPLSVTINNVTLSVTGLQDLADQVNQRTNSTLPGLSATLDATGTQVTLNSSTGQDLSINVAGDPGSSFDFAGIAGATQTLTVGGADTATVGGQLTITVESGFDINTFVPSGTGLFELETAIVETDVEINAFDPNNPSTFNNATSTTVFDSLGVPHTLTQYFVKQPFDPSDATSSPNHWQMHVLIDGQEVGAPDPLATDPLAATRATFDVFFTSSGALDEGRTFGTTDVGNNRFLIRNWNVEGTNSAVPLQPDVAGVLPIGESSNFEISISGSTQFGASFAVNSVDQDGFPAGQLSGLQFDDSGIVFAQFSNGESQALGQVLLADFTNEQGLQPIGNSAWVETFDSGVPTINTPGSAALGVIQASSLEESNVDLSEQLVALILAQRNFQANAQTIETADQVTQAIINI